MKEMKKLVRGISKKCSENLMFEKRHHRGDAGWTSTGKSRSGQEEYERNKRKGQGRKEGPGSGVIV